MAGIAELAMTPLMWHALVTLAVTLTLAGCLILMATSPSAYVACGPHCQVEGTVIHGLLTLAPVHG